jgi:hypothetical protein
MEGLVAILHNSVSIVDVSTRPHFIRSPYRRECQADELYPMKADFLQVVDYGHSQQLCDK